MVSPHKVLISSTLAVVLLVWAASCKPKEEVVLRKIKDISVDVSGSTPMLRANAVLYNPNAMKLTVKGINLEVFVEGKKAALIDQKLKIRVPAQAEFTIPLEVQLNLKELGFLDTVFSLIGGKKMAIQYKGSIRLQKGGIPFNASVNYKDDIKIKM